MRALTLIRQPRSRQRLTAEASLALLRAWQRVRFRQFREYAQSLGDPRPGSFATLESPEDLAFLRDLRWAIKAVDQTAGGRFTCLMQGIAGKEMLNRRGIANTLILGAKLGPSDDAPDAEMSAHAWLNVGPIVLLGGEARGGFVPVTSYHSEPARR